MTFIDEISIEVYGGKGGNGMASFRREKFVAFGGPSGGNGGKGGSVIFIGDEGQSSLYGFRYQRHIKAKGGSNGLSKSKHGANAEDILVRVPLVKIVYDFDTNEKIGEVLKNGELLVVADGGKGGRGNMAFATNKNPAPKLSENGDLGQYRKLRLVLKVLADIGVVGYPNVGKSTIISVISNARPKIDDYPFTTLIPNLGVVYHKHQDFVVADLPGLIEDASKGVGLGTRFLRHVERCRVFVHVVDATEEDPILNFNNINKELKIYNEKLLERPTIVVLNKIDQLNEDELNEIGNKFKDFNTVSISAMTTKNIDKLLDKMLETLTNAPKVEYEEEEVIYTLEKEDIDDGFYIEKDGDYFIIEGSKVELLFQRTNFSTEEGVRRFAQQLKSLGVDKKLRELGAKTGDFVQVLGYEFEFLDE